MSVRQTVGFKTVDRKSGHSFVVKMVDLESCTSTSPLHLLLREGCRRTT